MIFIICFITLLITLLLAGYCLGKALDIKFKDVDINNWWDNSEESVWGDKLIQHNSNNKDKKMMIKKNEKYFQYSSLNVFIVTSFVLTVKILLAIGKVFHLSYNAVNIIVWYMIIPLAWAAILDYKLHKLILSPMWLLLCVGIIILQRKQFNQFCDTMFRLSQIFIASFDNYYKWSVIICLLIPVMITAVLLLC